MMLHILIERNSEMWYIIILVCLLCSVCTLTFYVKHDFAEEKRCYC